MDGILLSESVDMYQNVMIVNRKNVIIVIMARRKLVGFLRDDAAMAISKFFHEKSKCNPCNQGT